MLEIDAHSAAGYLRGTGRIAAGEQVSVRELSGGVSNLVLMVERENSLDSNPLPPRFVLKQARGRLRVKQPWFCDVERNWREVQVLSACQRAIAAESEGAVLVETPRVLFTDAPNYLFAMTAAPAGHTTWKERLLVGNADVTIAAACGRTLGRLHAATWADAELARRLGDRSLFDALRIDPYYRAVAERDDALRPYLERLIESVAEHPRCLVHADFSPKNLLVWDRDGVTRMLLIDFETGHFGDPAFDLGFFATHLVLKRFYHAPPEESFAQLVDAFWREYRPVVESRAGAGETVDLARRAARNLGGCLLARLEGKSPVEYLTDPKKRADVRALAVRLLTDDEGAVFPDAIQNSL